MRFLRYHIGRMMLLCGYKMLPRGVRIGVSMIVAVGYQWSKENEKALDQIIKDANNR